jgi:ketosteroid isomerase-like protein
VVDAVSEVLETNQRLLRAFLQNDADALHSLLADDVIYIHATSAKDNKASLLSALVSGALLYRKFDVSEVETLDMGSWVRMSGKCSQAIFSNRRREEFSARFTCVYTEGQQGWQLSLWQATRLSSPQGKLS